MPQTPDRFPGEREEEGILFDTNDPNPPTVEGEVKYVLGLGFRYVEGGIVYPWTDTGGLTEDCHRTLRQLIHLADGAGGPFERFVSGAVRVTLGGAFPTNVTWYTNNLLLNKIVEKQIAYNPNKTISAVSWAVYGSDGITVIATASDSINYSGAFETDRTRTISDSPAPGIVTEQQHKALRELIHLADGVGGPFEGFISGAYRETIGGAFPTNITWYESSTKTRKIVEKQYTYTGTRQVDTTSWIVYDLDGVTPMVTATDSVTYSTFFESSRIRSIVSP